MKTKHLSQHTHLIPHIHHTLCAYTAKAKPFLSNSGYPSLQEQTDTHAPHTHTHTPTRACMETSPHIPTLTHTPSHRSRTPHTLCAHSQSGALPIQLGVRLLFGTPRVPLHHGLLPHPYPHTHVHTNSLPPHMRTSKLSLTLSLFHEDDLQDLWKTNHLTHTLYAHTAKAEPCPSNSGYAFSSNLLVCRCQQGYSPTPSTGLFWSDATKTYNGTCGGIRTSALSLVHTRVCVCVRVSFCV